MEEAVEGLFAVAAEVVAAEDEAEAEAEMEVEVEGGDAWDGEEAEACWEAALAAAEEVAAGGCVGVGW